MFGFDTFGRIYGTVVCFSGITNLAQPALDALTHEVFVGNPIPVNVALAAGGVVLGTALTIFVAVMGRKFADEQEFGGSDEQERLLPGNQAIGYRSMFQHT